MTPRKAPKSNLYAFRLPVELMKRVDEYLGTLQEETAWRKVTRADAIRALLTQALESHEKRVSKRQGG